jgi:hypothetical protein
MPAASLRRFISFCDCLCRAKKAESGAVKYWEIIANNLKKRGWSLGWVSAVDSDGRTIWIVDAHRDGKRFLVRTDEKLTAFVELESALLAATPRSYPGAVNLTGDFWGASRIKIDEK